MRKLPYLQQKNNQSYLDLSIQDSLSIQKSRRSVQLPIFITSNHQSYLSQQKQQIDPQNRKLSRYIDLFQFQNNQLTLKTEKQKPKPKKNKKFKVQKHLSIARLKQEDFPIIRKCSNLNDYSQQVIMSANKMDSELKKQIEVTEKQIRNNYFQKLSKRQKKRETKMKSDLVNVLSQMHDDEFISELIKSL